jgi:hypothetical protein
MPLNVEKLEDRNGMLISGIGVVNARDIAEAREEFHSEELRYLIVDVSRVERLDATSSELRALASASVAFSRGREGRLIAVVGEQDYMYGLARMWSFHVEEGSHRVGAFRCLTDAVAWVQEASRVHDGQR